MPSTDPGASAGAAELVGRTLPSGSYELEGPTVRAFAEAVRSPNPENVHPVLGFVITQRGLGIGLDDLFEMFASSAAAGPLHGRCRLEFHRPIVADERYDVEAVIVGAEDKRGASLGDFRLVTFRVDARDRSGVPVVTCTNTFLLPRATTPDNPPARGPSRPTTVSPTDAGRPNEARLEATGADKPSARRHVPPSAPPAASSKPPTGSPHVWQLNDVAAAAARIMATILDDPNPIHFDRAAVAAVGLGNRPINQGPSNLAYVVNAILEHYPDRHIDVLDVRFTGRVFVGDRVRATVTELSEEAEGRTRFSVRLQRIAPDQPEQWAGAETALEGTAVLR